MGKIIKLDQHITNMIAAGEVIEKVASVVKELVENSIDAGSTIINISLTEGGLKEIVVSDNGCGMDPADARMALEPHATSKIKSESDLFNIHTLGFRGEAIDELKDKEIYVVGHSWGGYATSNIVGLHPDINGICAISPFNSVYDIIRTSLPKQIRFLSWFVYLSDALHGGKFSRFKAYKSLDNYQGKAMLIQSLNDQVVKYNIGVGMIKEKTKNKNIEYIINDGRFHNPNYTDEAIKIMGKFYQESSKLSGKELQEYKRNFDFHKMGELDPLIMDKICEDIIG